MLEAAYRVAGQVQQVVRHSLLRQERLYFLDAIRRDAPVKNGVAVWTDGPQILLRIEDVLSANL